MDFINLSLQEKINLLHKAKSSYYETSEPIMSDEQYDELEDLVKSEQDDVEIGVNSRHNKSVHRNKMLSLSKNKINKDASNLNEIVSNVLRKLSSTGANFFDVSWKYDGLAINVEFEDRKLKQIVTRGNGIQGVDRTAKLRHLITEEFQKFFNEHVSGEIRCECVVRFDIFEKYYSDKAHPRNVASGLVGDENLETGKEHLELVVLEAIDVNAKVLDASSLPNYKVYWQVKDIKELLHVIEHTNNIRKDFRYPTDGLVVTSYIVGQELKHNGHYPNHACAIKFTPPASETIVTGIEWNLNKTGRYTPIVHFEPFVIDGRSISKASGHNLDWLVKNDVKKGSTIRIELSGDIIPYIVTSNI